MAGEIPVIPLKPETGRRKELPWPVKNCLRGCSQFIISNRGETLRGGPYTRINHAKDLHCLRLKLVWNDDAFLSQLVALS